MKLYVERPEATLPERMAELGDYLIIWYHKWDPHMFYYVDGKAIINMINVKKLQVVFGPRKGYKGLQIIGKQDQQLFAFSAAAKHRTVSRSIYRFFKDLHMTIERITSVKEVKTYANK